MYPRGRRRSGFWFTLRKRRTFAQKRSTSLPVLETSSGSDGQRERRWPPHFCEFYNGRSPLWSHGKHFPRPGRSTMAIWNDEEYVVVNLTDKIDYARAEICKFNPCLCISSSSTGIIFFSCCVFEKVSQNRKHCNSNLFNTTSYSTSLLIPNVCMRWVSELLKYQTEYCLVVFE